MNKLFMIAVAISSVAFIGVAYADDSARIDDLEDRVSELEDRLDGNSESGGAIDACFYLHHLPVRARPSPTRQLTVQLLSDACNRQTGRGTQAPKYGQFDAGALQRMIVPQGPEVVYQRR